MKVSQRRFEETPFGVTRVVARKVRKAPRRKEARETRVVVQPWGLLGRVAVERPRMTVLPVLDVSFIVCVMMADLLSVLCIGLAENDSTARTEHLTTSSTREMVQSFEGTVRLNAIATEVVQYTAISAYFSALNLLA